MLIAILLLLGFEQDPPLSVLYGARALDGEVSLEVQPTWSPDGRWAFYVLSEQSRSSDGDEATEESTLSLCVYALGANTSRRLYTGRISFGANGPIEAVDDYLTGRGYRPAFARWSPDSSRVIFFSLAFIGASINADGNPLLSVDPRTGTSRVLSKGWRKYGGEPVDMMMYDGTIEFSPDGKTLLLVIGAGRFPFEEKRIASISFPNGARKWLTDTNMASREPKWSQDGRGIVFVSGPETDHEGLELEHTEKLSRTKLFFMAGDGSRLRQLTSDQAYREESPHWSGDGAIRFVRTANATSKGGLDWDGKRSEWEIKSDGIGLRKIRDLPESP